MQEVWKRINDFENYEISNLGRVKSFKGKNVIILKNTKHHSGYLIVNLYKNKIKKLKSIHVLIFETFNNCKLKNNEIVHHIDFTKDNNNLDNLKLMTKSEHQSFHAINISEETRNKMIKNNKGENNPSAILKEIDVSDIRKSLKYKLYTPKQLSWMYNVSLSYIYKIKNNKHRINHGDNIIL